MNRIVNLLRGSVKVEIYGEYPEQYINSLAKLGIQFWRFRKLGPGLASVNLPSSAVRELERVKQGTDCDAKVVRKSGLPYFLFGLRRRWALFAGLIACFIGVSVLSLFIWEIEVTGNEKVATSEILKVLDELGVHIGTFSLSIDQQDIRSRALYKIKELSWLTVNVVGTKAEVIVRERIPKPDIVEEKTPTVVVATKSGVITRTNVFRGQLMVSVGQTVAEGDILVGSQVKSLNSGDRIVHAMAEIYARTWYEFTYEMPLKYINKIYTGGDSSRTSVNLFGNRINLYLSTGFSDTFCDKIIESRKVILPGGYTLPITITKETYVEYEAETAEMDVRDAEEILKARLDKRLGELTGDAEKVSVKYETKVEDGIIKVTARAECIEQIGKIQNLP